MHTFLAQGDEAGEASWAAMRDYVVNTAGVDAVVQHDPTPIGIPTNKWVQRISPLWFWEQSENDAEGAEAMANHINAVTAAGGRVAIDEIRIGPEDITSFCAYVVPLLTHPWMTYWYLVTGRSASYEMLDWDFANPPITSALEMGATVMPEIYVGQYETEQSGDPVGYIDAWLRGPGDTKMPYLLETQRWLNASTDQIRFILAVTDRFTRDRNGRRKAKLPYAKHLDLVMSRCWRVYPKIAANGFGTWKWHQPYVRSYGRAAIVAQMLVHYSVGQGAQTKGKVKFFDT